ncbi:MAG: complex I NDUFA9 subunit family protein [Steroidobacteraceae bacterium]
MRICVLGGTGFVGSALVGELARRGHQLRVLTRNPLAASHLRVLPQLQLQRADAHLPQALSRELADADVAINLIGILNEGRDAKQRYASAHVSIAKNLLAACRANAVPRLLQMSALGASADAPSAYLRSRADAEQLLSGAGGVATTIFRPSVIFGRNDTLLNRFAALLRIAPLGIMPLARADTRFAPVWVGDVVRAFVRALRDPATAGQCYELCGPQVLTLAQLVEYAAQLTGQRCHILRLPDSLGALQAAVLGLLPGRPLTLDNFRSLERDSVCSVDGLAALGIRPTQLGSIAPTYLGRGAREARLAGFRERAGR